MSAGTSDHRSQLSGFVGLQLVPGEQPQVSSDFGSRAAAVGATGGRVQTLTLSIIVDVSMIVSGGEVSVSGGDVRVWVTRILEAGKVAVIVVPACV